MRLPPIRPVILLVIFLSGGWNASAAPVAATSPDKLSVVRVNVTNQPYDFYRPWSKKAPFSRQAIGAVLPGNRVLVTAELVANSNYLELEKAESGEKVAATVEVVDYEANLALLRPANPKFLEDFKALELADARIGDRLSVWQLESTGDLLITDALMTAVDVSRYPIDDLALLIYKMTSSLQYREGSFTLPVVKGGKLVGLLMRYDPRSQNVDVIPAPVIRHFLTAASQKEYHGIPRAGIAFAPMRDPQLRRYTGYAGRNGVYLTDIAPDSPAAAAGLEEGDVLLSLAGKTVDQDGNYVDPLYGKLSLSHLISMKADGEKLPVEIFREGDTKKIELTVEHRNVRDHVIEPYVIDRAPKFYVLGGLVMQELSEQYLKEWGNEWTTKAPERLVYLARYQEQLFNGYKGKIVILGHVLPSSSTVGYEQLGHLVVKRINNQPITGLADVAAAVEHPIDGFHKIEFDEAPSMIFLDASQVAADDADLIRSYGLPETKRLD